MNKIVYNNEKLEIFKWLLMGYVEIKCSEFI